MNGGGSSGSGGGAAEGGGDGWAVWSGGACCALRGEARIMNAVQASAIRGMLVSPFCLGASASRPRQRIDRRFGADTR